MEFFVHEEGDLKCDHAFLPFYIGLGFWGQKCHLCDRLIEEKVPGYNCPVEETHES